ncbi:MAG: S-layer homology domain-containing protein [Oscillospiraceae bacterium]|jgi:hypothetical protein|nr:S-layer homology domain-containing protein [Oscillospiraceae bacterium]
MKKQHARRSRIIAVLLSAAMTLSLAASLAATGLAAQEENTPPPANNRKTAEDRLDIASKAPLGYTLAIPVTDISLPFSATVTFAPENTLLVDGQWQMLGFKFTLTETTALFFQYGDEAFGTLNTSAFSDYYTFSTYISPDTVRVLSAGDYWLYVDDDGYLRDNGSPLTADISITPVTLPSFDRGAYGDNAPVYAAIFEEMMVFQQLENFNAVFSTSLAIDDKIGELFEVLNEALAQAPEMYGTPTFTADSTVRSVINAMLVAQILAMDNGANFVFEDFAADCTTNQILAVFLALLADGLSGYDFASFTLGDSLESLGDVLQALMPIMLPQDDTLLYYSVPYLGNGMLTLTNIPECLDSGTLKLYYGDYYVDDINNQPLDSAPLTPAGSGLFGVDEIRALPSLNSVSLDGASFTNIENPGAGTQIPIHLGRQWVYLADDNITFAILVDVADGEEPYVVRPGWNPFGDVAEKQWYYTAVKYIYEHRLFAGMDDKTFAPDTKMTRAMLVSVLWSYMGNPAPDGLSSFSDVPADAWYAKAVAWAQENRIVSGVGDNKFAPDAPITRQDFVVVLANYAAQNEITLPELRPYKPFSDQASIADYAKAAVEKIFRAKVISGYEDGTFKPTGEATRAEVAAMIYQFARLEA